MLLRSSFDAQVAQGRVGFKACFAWFFFAFAPFRNPGPWQQPLLPNGARRSSKIWLLTESRSNVSGVDLVHPENDQNRKKTRPFVVRAFAKAAAFAHFGRFVYDFFVFTALRFTDNSFCSQKFQRFRLHDAFTTMLHLSLCLLIAFSAASSAITFSDCEHTITAPAPSNRTEGCEQDCR